MSKTVLITGSSSGIGKATALYFQKKGWNVAATMRNPQKDKNFKDFSNIITPKLDVSNYENVKEAIAQTIDRFGSLDVVVNNAGYAIVGPFEAISMEEARKQFDVNLFGAMNIIKEILPYFRQKGRGTIVTVTSMGGRMTFPLYSTYHSTKWALEGFLESLAFEVRKLGINIKIIEPGIIKTPFYTTQKLVSIENLPEYKKMVDTLSSSTKSTENMGSSPDKVAKVIFRAANSNSFRLRYSAAGWSSVILSLRRILPEIIFRWVIAKASA